MEQAYKELGFSETDKRSVTYRLNSLLANYQLYYQKLRNFHWNVTSPDFFDIHQQLELEYNEVRVHIDEVAERIRTFGSTPLSNFTDYLEKSEVKESDTDLSVENMVSTILSDINILFSYHIEAIEAANEVGDLSTTDLLTKELKRIEKKHWMLRSFLAK